MPHADEEILINEKKNENYSQQGFEASHKDQRQLWLRASSHDCKGQCASGMSVKYWEQIDG